MTLVKWRNPSNRGLTNSSAYLNTPFSSFIENFFNDQFFPKEHASFVPAVNVVEENNGFQIELSAPGFDKNDFKVELDNGVLTISGEHKSEKENSEKNYTRKEFSFGSFQRSFTMPEDIKEDKIEAKYENGILKLTLPKVEKTQVKTTKQISIS